MSRPNVNEKCFSEVQRVTWCLSPYNHGIGLIRGRVKGISEAIDDDDWWIVELECPYGQDSTTLIPYYEYSCIVVPGYRLQEL